MSEHPGGSHPYSGGFRYEDIIKYGGGKKFVHGDKTHVNTEINRAFVSHVEYRLCLGFHPEGREPEGQRPVGWGAIAVKVDKDEEPRHYPFKICHKGYLGTFSLGSKSVLVRCCLPAIAAFL